jgi:drug/metabolite transporter (DMT)-like permease
VVLCVGIGLHFAPAAHAGALFPGMLPVFAALLASAVLHEPLEWTKKIGLAFSAAGVVALAGVTLGGRQTIGHVLFLTAAVLWASYTVAMRRARLDGLHAAAVAAVASLLAYVPVYALLVDKRLFHAPWRDIIIQGFYQGVLTMVVSLFLSTSPAAARCRGVRASGSPASRPCPAPCPCPATPRTRRPC